MSGNIIYDLFDAARSFQLPNIAVETPHITKAYFAQKKLTSNGVESTALHTVTSSDTLGKIARENNTTVQRLVDLNHIQNENVIRNGQQLLIPTTITAGNSVNFEKITEMPLNGEAYIVVETQNFREKTLKINIKQGVQDMLNSVDASIEVEVDGARKSIIEAKVSEFALNESPVNVDDLLDLAAIKIKFTAADDESNARWAEKIGDSENGYAPVYLFVDAHTGNTDIPQSRFLYYGRNEGTNSSRNQWLDMDGAWFKLTSTRAPWMEVLLAEAIAAAGVKETKNPLKRMVEEKYHPYAGLRNANAGKNSWCASFVGWVLGQKGYENPMSARSRDFIDTAGTYFKSVQDPVYGAIATWSDCTKSGSVLSHGHVSFLFGKLSSSSSTEKYLFLGGNQGNMLKVSSYDATGDVYHAYTTKDKTNADGTITKGAKVYRKFRGFFVPNTYNVSAVDDLAETDTYTSIPEANRIATSVSLDSHSLEST